MTFSCNVLGSLPLDFFLQTFQDLLGFRVSIGSEMGLFGVPFDTKLVDIL